MPRPRQLSGSDVIKIREQFGFYPYSQHGSHIKLRRYSEVGKETLTIPNHRLLDTGTCRAIYRQACRYIPETELFSHFYQKKTLINQLISLESYIC